MTGQVKEDILSRFGELGVKVENGRLHFHPILLRRSEFLTEPKTFTFINLQGESQSLPLPVDSLAFTYCQIPVVYLLSEKDAVTVYLKDASQLQSDEPALDLNTSQSLFRRTGEVLKIEFSVSSHTLK